MCSTWILVVVELGNIYKCTILLFHFKRSLKRVEQLDLVKLVMYTLVSRELKKMAVPSKGTFLGPWLYPFDVLYPYMRELF